MAAQFGKREREAIPAPPLHHAHHHRAPRSFPTRPETRDPCCNLFSRRRKCGDPILGTRRDPRARRTPGCGSRSTVALRALEGARSFSKLLSKLRARRGLTLGARRGRTLALQPGAISCEKLLDASGAWLSDTRARADRVSLAKGDRQAHCRSPLARLTRSRSFESRRDAALEERREVIV